MKYSFPLKELSGWKGRIGERLVELYIKDILIPQLKNEWVEVLLWRNPPVPINWTVKALLNGEKIDWEEAYNETVIEHVVYDNSGKRKNMTNPPKKERKFWIEQWKKEKQEEAARIPKTIKEYFLEKRVYPDSHLHKNTVRLFSLLEVATDGILFKLKNTGRTATLKKAFFPVVSGEIEVIETKSGKSNLPPSQKRNYRDVLQEGYALRFFQVNIVSFEKNEFEIKEKLIASPTELRSFPKISLNHQ